MEKRVELGVGAVGLGAAAAIGLLLKTDDAKQAIDKWVDQGYIADEKKITALTMYLTEGPGKLQPQEYHTEKPKPTLMVSAAKWWKQQKLELQEQKRKRELEFQKERLEVEKGKFELKKAGLELEDKKEEEERRRIETVIKNAHTIADMEKFSDSEAADFNKLVLDKWNPLHQILRGNTDLHATRWRLFLPKPLEFHGSQTTFGRKYVLDSLNQEGIKGWDQIRKDVCADYKGRGFEHLQVSYQGEGPDQLGVPLGKSMYACDEAELSVRVKHYAASGLCFAALLESIFRVLDKNALSWASMLGKLL